jgi:sulfofructose kinase
MNALPLLTFCGVATADAIAVVGRYPGADERIVADDIVFGGGGPAATAAVAAARQGMHTAFIGVVGDDESGERIAAELAKEGVDTSGISRAPGGSARSVVVIDGPRKTRSISNRPGSAIDLARNDSALEILAKSQWVHVDQHGWAPIRSYLDSRPSTARPKLSVDAGNPIPGYVGRETDLYAPTMPALRERYGHGASLLTVPELLDGALNEGAELVAVTNGGEGAFLMSGNRQLVEAPTPSVQINSTLGAGDVFHGALLAALVMYDNNELDDLQDVLGYATTVASLSCRGLDGRSAIPDRQEMSTFLNRTFSHS